MKVQGLWYLNAGDGLKPVSWPTWRASIQEALAEFSLKSQDPHGQRLKPGRPRLVPTAEAEFAQHAEQPENNPRKEMTHD